MEKQENQPQIINKNKCVDKWFAGYVVAGLIWYFSQGFSKTTTDELVILIIAIGAGFFYHRLKTKIKIKNEVARITITFVILEIIAGGLVGFLTTLL